MTADIETHQDLPYGQPERKEVSQKFGFSCFAWLYSQS